MSRAWHQLFFLKEKAIYHSGKSGFVKNAFLSRTRVKCSQRNSILCSLEDVSEYVVGKASFFLAVSSSEYLFYLISTRELDDKIEFGSCCDICYSIP
jgi:hypothetical protein